MTAAIAHRQNCGEGSGAVAGAVVGDDAVDVVDAASGEPYSRAVHESDCCNCFLVIEGFGVSQPAQSVDPECAVEVTGGVKEPPTVQPEPGEDAGNGAHTDLYPGRVELDGDWPC